jgi:uncharacterized membrane protein HdeD (DUF308 family)
MSPAGGQAHDYCFAGRSAMHKKLPDELAGEWWSVGLRGVLAVVAGIVLYVSPIPHVDHLLRVFGAYMIADGIIDLFMAVRTVRRRQSWLRMGLSGVLGIVFGFVNVVGGGLPAAVRAGLIGVRTFISGISSVLAARKMRAALPDELPEWLLMLSAVGSIVFSVIILVGPTIRARLLGRLDWLAALYLVGLGVLWLVLAVRLRALSHMPTSAATRS